MARISKEQQHKIRDTIIQVARDYFYNEGFEKTSTKKIAKKVGIAEGTIFNYFLTKADLFFETIRQDYLNHQPDAYDFKNVESKISEVITSYIFKTMGFMIKLPKRILLELFVAAVKMGKKHPQRLKKLAELDFEYMEGLQAFLDSLVDKQMIRTHNTKETSEIIFGALMFELTMYLYEETISKDLFHTRVESKIELIIDGLMKGDK